MARYIDADVLIAHLEDELKGCEIPFGSRANRKGIAYGTKLGLNSAISFAKTLSTEDVVPAAEVEELIGKFECFLCHVTGSRLSKHTYDLGTMESVATDCINETYNDGYGEGYKDCAREIFEEIEKIFVDAINGSAFYGMQYAELKKKHIKN